MKEGFVYILQSEKNYCYYIGASKNPMGRIIEHNKGTTASTRNKGPWVLKFTQQFPTLKEAKQMEYKLKKLKRRDYIEKIINDGFIKKI